MPHQYNGLLPADIARFDEDFQLKLLQDSNAPRELRMTALDLLRRETLHHLLETQALVRASDRILLGYALTRLIDMAVTDGGEVLMTWCTGPDGQPAVKRLIYYEADHPRQGRSR
jgi:hypothetical protein